MTERRMYPRRRASGIWGCSRATAVRQIGEFRFARGEWIEGETEEIGSGLVRAEIVCAM
jgi:hypothetical protein